jgi:hypothetical protein
MVKKQVEKDICDVCDKNEVHWFTDQKNKNHNYTCSFCNKEICIECLRTVKLYSNGKNIQMIECCKDCFEQKDFSIQAENK